MADKNLHWSAYYKIDKGIPPGELKAVKKHGMFKALATAMNVGDSVLVATEGEAIKLYQAIRNMKRASVRLRVPGGYRVWLVDAETAIKKLNGD